MILDNNAIFSDSQAIVATAVSTNVYDLGLPGKAAYGQIQLRRDFKDGLEIPLFVQIMESFNNLTSIKVEFVSDNASDLSSPTVLFSETILLADALAGKKINITEFPAGIKERYVGLKYTVTGTAPSTGKIFAGIVAGEVPQPYVG